MLRPYYDSLFEASNDVSGPSPWYTSVENIILALSTILLITLVTIRLYQNNAAAP
eukprot:UN18631